VIRVIRVVSVYYAYSGYSAYSMIKFRRVNRDVGTIGQGKTGGQLINESLR
jgi:hypothetical protein